MNRTLVGEVQALCTATVLDQQTLELARSLELRSDAYRASALPVELYQRSWRGDSNADHRLTRPVLFPLSYTSKNSFRWWENCTPDELHCRQTPCCLATPPQPLERSTGIAPVFPDWRSGVLLLYELRVWSEQRELNSRHQLGRLRHQPLYHARFKTFGGRNGS